MSWQRRAQPHRAIHHPNLVVIILGIHDRAIRLSLAQLCGVNKAPLQLRAALMRRKQSPPHRVLGIEAWLHRDAAMMPPTASQRRPAMGFCTSSFTSWSSLHRKRRSQAKIDSETTARQFENATFNGRMCSPSSTPSHPISIKCNRDERCEGWKLCVEAAVQTSDGVGHVSPQSACRIHKATSRVIRHGSEVPVRKRPINRVRKNILRGSEPRQTGAGLQKKPRGHARESNPLRETISVSFGTFHKSLQGPPASHVLRNSKGAQDTGHHQHVVWHVSPVVRSRETVLLQELSGTFFARKKAIAMRCTCSLCTALSHALLFACTPFSAKNALTVIFTSSEDPPERSVALVPWL